MFSNFILQTSPKNSIFFRFRKTYLGHLLSGFSKLEIDVPNPNNEYVGIRKTNKLILVEMENCIPKWVWKKDKNQIWHKEEFLGYQIISKFSVSELMEKKELITKALLIHWAKLGESLSNIHGDFTHFNILADNNGKIHFIDKKRMENSKLFDFFYFYSYFRQSVCQKKSISKKTKRKLLTILESIIKNVCKYDNRDAFELDYSNLNIPNDSGVEKKRLNLYLIDFYKLF